MSDSEKVFYFFVENEFVCRPDVSLLQVSPANYSSNAITINLVSFTSKGIKEVYKIFKKVTPNGYNRDEMVELYKQTKEYINLNFINNDKNKLFIGCVRDDNGTHENCTENVLKFKCRTDPIHDIFNILMNIYLSKVIIVDDNLKINYEDLNRLLPHLYGIIPIVGYFYIGDNNVAKRDQRVWIPNINRPLKKFMRPIRYLFSIDYYESIDINIPDFEAGAKEILKLILLLKKILKFIQEQIIDSVTVENFRDFYNQLKKYSFQKVNQDSRYNTRCLNSLKATMKTNIDFFDGNQVPFKPIMFSTLMIEAEKGKLRYESFEDVPTITQCENWFRAAMTEGSYLNAFSEFGRCALNFLPLEIEPMEDPFEVQN